MDFLSFANILSFRYPYSNTLCIHRPEIDDQLPRLLGFDQDAIIENYLLEESKLHYEEYAIMTDKDVNNAFPKADVESQVDADRAYGVNFCDYFLTNSVLEGSDAHDFSQPFVVKKADNNFGHELSPSNYITDDCLLKKVEWRYVDSKAISPTIGYLRLTKLSGEVVEIDLSENNEVERGTLHQLDGVYVITNFIMTASEIESLRIAGSDTGNSFMTGISQYSLWELTFDAKSLLRKKLGLKRAWY